MCLYLPIIPIHLYNQLDWENVNKFPDHEVFSFSLVSITSVGTPVFDGSFQQLDSF